MLPFYKDISKSFERGFENLYFRAKRFLSPDKYVQEGDNSQNYNSYSYCLNNPLKYADPSGNVFVLDDFIAITAMGAMMGAMNAAMSDKPIWKGALLGAASTAATYGIGSIFNGVGTFGHELLRAGAHGLSSGVFNALNGDNFWNGLISGAASSGIGSYAQSINLNSGLMVASTTAMGGIVAWATGGDFLQGALQGIMIGVFNHAMHDDDNIMGGKAECEVLPDGTRVAPKQLRKIVVSAHRIYKLPNVPVEKPLESVYPEFGFFLFERAVIEGVFQDFWTVLKYETGGWKQWVRLGNSYSKSGDFQTRSLRWGASPYYTKKIGNPTLRNINQSLRNTKFPYDNWRTADPGHIHYNWRLNDKDSWHWFR